MLFLNEQGELKDDSPSILQIQGRLNTSSFIIETDKLLGIGSYILDTQEDAAYQVLQFDGIEEVSLMKNCFLNSLYLFRIILSISFFLRCCEFLINIRHFE